MMKWEAEQKGYDCNDCYLSMQNCKDRSICCEDETGLCDWFEEIPEYMHPYGDPLEVYRWDEKGEAECSGLD